MDGDYTQWTVIRRAAAGSAADREAFAHKYAPIIRAYLGARWRGTSRVAEIDDATQQVFVECFRENGALATADPERGGFRGYLYGVTRNVARAMERRLARNEAERREGGHRLEGVLADEESLARIFDRAWAQRVVRDASALQLERALALGPDAVRRHDLLALRFGEGLPIREIAARWEVDPERLHREYPKAREEFRRALMDVVRELHGGSEDGIERECARLRQFFS